jgi:Ca2+/H+ antiporter
LLDISILSNKFKSFALTYKELFILLGTITLVWLVVAIIIKKFVRKDKRSDFLENHTDNEKR